MHVDLIATKLPVYIDSHMLTVEFTIEPFVEGDPGVHVTGAVAAVEALASLLISARSDRYLVLMLNLCQP
jgi:hypothetical protein